MGARARARARVQVKVAKPLGAVMEESEDGKVLVKEVKEGGNAAATQAMQPGDEILRVNGKLLMTAGFDAVMGDLIAAEGEVELTMARPIPDRDVDFATLSEAEQKARYQSSGVIKVLGLPARTPAPPPLHLSTSPPLHLMPCKRRRRACPQLADTGRLPPAEATDPGTAGLGRSAAI